MSEETTTESVPEVALDTPVNPSIFAALAAAQAKFPVIKTNKTATVRMKAEKGGGEYTYNYCSLDAILDAVRAPLAEEGLTIRHVLLPRGGFMWVDAVLSHASGGELHSGVIPIPEWNNMQDLGGGLTYARRYTVNALLGICPEDDDDGQRAPTGNPLRDQQRRTEPPRSSKQENATAAQAAATKRWTKPEILDEIARSETAKGLAEFLTARVGQLPVVSHWPEWIEFGKAAKARVEAATWPEAQKALVLAVLSGVRNEIDSLKQKTPDGTRPEQAAPATNGDAPPSLEALKNHVDSMLTPGDLNTLIQQLKADKPKSIAVRSNFALWHGLLEHALETIDRRADEGKWKREDCLELSNELADLAAAAKTNLETQEAFGGNN